MTQEEMVRQIVENPDVQQMLRQGFLMRVKKGTDGEVVITLDNANPPQPTASELATVNPSILYWAAELSRAFQLTRSETNGVLQVLLPENQNHRFVGGVWTAGKPTPIPGLTDEQTQRVLSVAHLADYCGTVRERRKAAQVKRKSKPKK